MVKIRDFALTGVLVLGTAALSAGPAFAFSAGGHGGGGGGGFGGGGGGFGGGHEGGFGGGHEGGLGRGADARGLGGGDRLYTGRSVGIDRGRDGYGRGFYRDGVWIAYDCSPVGIEEGLCPDGDAY